MPETPTHRKQKSLGRLAYWIYRIYSATFRYRLYSEDPAALEHSLAKLNRLTPEPGEAFLCAFWHQDGLSLLPYCSKRNIVAMVSGSKDGTIMATVLEGFGYLTTRGSSSRGGVKAFVASLKMIRKGYHFTTPVDGPRGPIHKTKEGVIRLAEKSGQPILPFRAWPRQYITIWKAWDKAKLPLPFARIDIVIGRPDMYTRDETDHVLNSLTVP
jgi:lysophospholipid acyltransferase (LPLAT)-like uncharacterized protein